MKLSIHRKSRALPRMLVLGVFGGVAIAAAAEQVKEVIVKTEVNVKSDTNAFADPVETVPTNTKLQVLSRKDGYLRVRTPSGNEGFISEGDLPSNTQFAAGTSTDAAVRGLSTDTAGRGEFPETREYAKTKNMTVDGLKQMTALGDSITDNDLIAFGKVGHVGPKKFRQ